MTSSEVRSAELRFTAAQVGAFRDFSRDRNPLHTDAEYSRRTQFGQAVVFGVAGVLSALGMWAGGRRFELTFLRAKFERPLFEGETYRMQISESNGQMNVRILKGTQLQSRITFAAQVLEEAKVFQEGPLPQERENHAHAQFQPRSVARDWNPEMESEAGAAPRPGSGQAAEEVFYYSPDWGMAGEFEGAFGLRRGQLPWWQLSALLWSSYFVGMEVPGQQALFTGLEFNFAPSTGSGQAPEGFEVRELKTAWDARFGLVTISGSGTGIESLQLNALKRPKPVEYSVEEIRATLRLGSGQATSTGSGRAAAEVFQGRTFFISGAARGFGEVLARTAAVQGGMVAANYRSEKMTPGLRALESELQAASTGSGQGQAGSFLVRGDVSNGEDCRRMREEVFGRFGKLDYLVCNAFPVIGAGGFLVQSPGEFLEFVRRSLSAGVELLHAFLPKLEAGSTVVYISSIYASAPREQFSHYVAAKRAAEGLVETLAREFKHVRFVVARPPKMLTDQTNLAFDREAPVSAVAVAGRLWGAVNALSGEGNFRVVELGTEG